jgi:chromosome segregation ATPase
LTDLNGRLNQTIRNLETELLSQRHHTEDLKTQMDEELARVDRQLSALDEKLHASVVRENDFVEEIKQLKEVIRVRDMENVQFKSELQRHLDHIDSQSRELNDAKAKTTDLESRLKSSQYDVNVLND